jgi:hypothetical protein
METLLIILIVGAVAYAIYTDAKARGMNAVGWAIGVALFMIVVLPIYLIVRKPRLPEVK